MSSDFRKKINSDFRKKNEISFFEGKCNSILTAQLTRTSMLKHARAARCYARHSWIGRVVGSRPSRHYWPVVFEYTRSAHVGAPNVDCRGDIFSVFICHLRAPSFSVFSLLSKNKKCASRRD